MAKVSKSAWKCDICSQTLSSKQVAKFHVELKHPEADQTKCNVVRVNITVTNKADNVLVIKKEKISRKESKPRKKVFPFSNQLSHAFNYKMLWEPFSLSIPRCKNTKESNKKKISEVDTGDESQLKFM